MFADCAAAGGSLADLAEDGDAWTWLPLPAGAVYGPGITALGLRPAAARAAKRLPEILAALSRA